MRIYTFIGTLAVVVAFGCATERYAKAHGDLGRFILQRAIDYGGVPSVTNGLPVVTSSWRYTEDAHGMQIYSSASDYSSVEVFLDQAFAGSRQFGPKVSSNGTQRIHEYRLSPKGGGVQLAGDSTETSVVILKPKSKL